MCILCDTGQMPTVAAFREIENRAHQLRSNHTPMPNGPCENFLQEVRELDSLRWGNGPEWGNEQTAGECRELVFRRPPDRGGPQRGLALFLMACWLDRRVHYEVVWADWHRGLDEWLCGPPDNEPPGRYSLDKEHVRATRRVEEQTPGGVAGWFARQVIGISETHGSQHGNTYRLLGHMMLELLGNLGQDARRRAERLANGNEVLIAYKRAWMALMFLRRDRTLVRCLVERALQALPGNEGERAHRLWYDGNYFTETESQLPVDVRVKEGVKILFPGWGNTESRIMRAARNFADQHIMPSSTFDVLFFGHERRGTSHCEQTTAC